LAAAMPRAEIRAGLVGMVLLSCAGLIDCTGTGPVQRSSGTHQQPY
jgi:hypothetical protein